MHLRLILSAALFLSACAGQAGGIFGTGADALGEQRPDFRRPGVQPVYRARITAVSDGDTVRATDENGLKHKIRLAYVDAPELQQAHGAASRRALAHMLEYRTVEVKVFERDRYGREVAQVWLEGRDANLAQLENGHAWHYVSIARKKQSKPDYAAYARAQLQARGRRLGLWSGKPPQAPWDFRREGRQGPHPQ